jgi:hypothetical protein
MIELDSGYLRCPGTVCPKTPLHIREMTGLIVDSDEFFDKKLNVYDNKMTEIEKTEGEIKVLQAKLELLKEMENHKSPAEEAYKGVYGWYPPTTPNVSNYEDNRWSAFQNGYNASKEDCKVDEEPTPQEPAKGKVLLYTRFEDEGNDSQIFFDDALRVVRSFLVDEAVIENEDHEYITFTLQKSLLEFPNV